MKNLLPMGFGMLLLPVLFTSPGQGDLRVISERIWHLGNDATPEWSEAPAAPEGAGMSVAFQGRAFAGEGVLFVRQRDVHNVWHIELNGQRIAQLRSGDEQLNEHHYVIPAGCIVDGENRLSLVGETPADDILFGDIRFAESSLRQWYQLRRVRLSVSQVQAARRTPLPARITITNLQGQLVELFYGHGEGTAQRKGLVYTAGQAAEVELPPGDYWVYASHGLEWSRAKTELHIAHDSLPDALYGVELELRREVQTPGFVAADTHIHTLTHSGHGDASVEERQITLAGEGVELAIATDHNHNIDYAPIQARMGLSSWYTSVIGNEVTTPIGHFNAFPLRTEDPVPPHESSDFDALMGGMRERGARAIILNHPRWPEGASSPFASIGFDARTGYWSGAWGAGYDAMELVNSDTEEEDPLALYRDWFGLMNRGQAVVSVGASDSHAVGVVVGQGRTYVQSEVEDVGQLDIEACSDNIARGRSSVSMGIFVNLLDDSQKTLMGQQVSANVEQPLPPGLILRVAAPGWVRPKRMLVFANGVQVGSMDIATSEAELGSPFEAHLALGPELQLPKHDYWLVAVVLGDGIDEPFWPLLNDYTLASTNPLFVDVDGDGVFSCAREIAQQGLAQSGTQAQAVLELLSRVDAPTAAQVMRLVRIDYERQASRRAHELVQSAVSRDPKLEDWVGGDE